MNLFSSFLFFDNFLLALAAEAPRGSFSGLEA